MGSVTMDIVFALLMKNDFWANLYHETHKIARRFGEKIILYQFLHRKRKQILLLVKIKTILYPVFNNIILVLEESPSRP